MNPTRHLVPDWKDCWRWASTWLAVAFAAWEMVPSGVQMEYLEAVGLPPRIVPVLWILLFFAGRLWAQLRPSAGGGSPLALLLVLLLPLGGCATRPEWLENSAACTLAGDKAVALSHWGALAIGSTLREADAKKMCELLRQEVRSTVPAVPTVPAPSHILLLLPEGDL